MKFLKGLFITISVVCIAFTCFFVYSYATARTAPITMVGKSITKFFGGKTANSSTGDTKSAISMLTDSFGLTTSQAGEVVSLASELGIDTSNADEVRRLIEKNSGKADQIESIASSVQSGTMSEAEAKVKLANILDV